MHSGLELPIASAIRHKALERSQDGDVITLKLTGPLATAYFHAALTVDACYWLDKPASVWRDALGNAYRLSPQHHCEGLDFMEWRERDQQRRVKTGHLLRRPVSRKWRHIRSSL